MGGIGPGSTRGLPGMSDDENGPLLGGGVGALGAGLCGYSDSGVGDDEGSSSSSEDTSDEAYAARHRFMEDEEHRRYAAVVAGECLVFWMCDDGVCDRRTRDGAN